MRINIIFKGLLREPLVLGIPLIPLLFVGLFLGFGGLYLFKPLWFLIPVAIIVMRNMAKDDIRIFTILFKKLMVLGDFRLNKRNGYLTFTANTPYQYNTKDNDLVVINQGKNSYLNHHIPYDFNIDNVVVTKNLDFCMTYMLKGFAYELEDPDILEAHRDSLNMFFRDFANRKTSFYVHCVRKDVNTFSNIEFFNDYLQEIHTKYYDEMVGLKENLYFVTVIYSPFNMQELKKFRKSSEEDQKIFIKEAIEYMEGISISFESSFNKYSLTRLGIYKSENNPNITFNSQLEFYNFLIGHSYMSVLNTDTPIYNILNGNAECVQFGEDIGEITRNDGTKEYFQIIEIKDFSNTTFTGVFDNLLYTNTEFISCYSFKPKDNTTVMKNIETQQKRLVMQGDKGVSQIADLNYAMDGVTNGDFIFGDFNFTLVIYGKTVKDLKRNVSNVNEVLSMLGFLITKADLALASSYFSILPSNFKYCTRTALMSSINFSDFISFHNFNRGKEKGNQWGNALTMFKTLSGQPYYFNLHETRDNVNDFEADKFLLGNALIIGKSGGGKTVLMNFLLTQLLQYVNKDSFAKGTPEDKKKATFFYLDKDKGAIGNILACGGKYLTIDNGQPTGFNPLMVDNTPDNITMLQTLITKLVTRNGEVLTSREQEMLNNAVISAMNLPKEIKTNGITVIMDHLTENIEEANSLKSRLKLWQKGNKYGWLFDNEIDELNFETDINVFGIDGTDLLSNDAINDVAAFYILWRILDLADGRRYGLIIDEAWDWLRNKTVAEAVFDKEKTIRKQNGFLVLATQSLEDFSKSDMTPALLGQAATIILLSNPQAKEEEYIRDLHITQTDFEFVRDTPPSLYAFMVKKNNGEKTRVRLDLSSLGKTNLSILSTGTMFVDIIEDNIVKKKLNYKDTITFLRNLYKK